MNIKTKFAIGDDVYFMDGSKPATAKVIGMVIFLGYSGSSNSLGETKRCSNGEGTKPTIDYRLGIPSENPKDKMQFVQLAKRHQEECYPSMEELKNALFPVNVPKKIRVPVKHKRVPGKKK